MIQTERVPLPPAAHNNQASTKLQTEDTTTTHNHSSNKLIPSITSSLTLSEHTQFPSSSSLSQPTPKDSETTLKNQESVPVPSLSNVLEPEPTPRSTEALSLKNECVSRPLSGVSEDWPPPYQPPITDSSSIISFNLPELPPPPLPYTDQVVELPEDPFYIPPLPPPPPITQPLDLIVEDPSSSPSLYRSYRQLSKFPINLYVPPSSGDRRPSNTSNYDNISEEEDQSVDRLLEMAATLPQNPMLGIKNTAYPLPSEDATSLSLPPPSMFFYTPDSSPLPPPPLCTEEASNWVTPDCIFPQPPVGFEDQPFLLSSVPCSQLVINQNEQDRGQSRPPRLPPKKSQTTMLPPVHSDYRLHVPSH